MTARGLGAAAICLAACGFGAVSVLAKLAFEAGSEPRSLLATRLVVAALVLFGVARPTRSPRLLLVAGAGGASFAAAGFLEFEALARLPAPALAVLLFLAPIWVALGSRIAWGRRVRRLELALLAAAFLGILLLVGSPAGPGLDPGGVALATGASVLYAGTFLLIEDLVSRHGPALSIASIMGVAALAALAVQPGGPIQELSDSATAAYALAIGVLTGGSMLLLAAGLVTTPAFAASVVTGAEPVVVALLSWILLGELLSGTQMLGGGLVVTAVVCVAARGPARRTAPGTSPARTARPPRSRPE